MIFELDVSSMDLCFTNFLIIMTAIDHGRSLKEVVRKEMNGIAIAHATSTLCHTCMPW